jgi:hypothetical protein
MRLSQFGYILHPLPEKENDGTEKVIKAVIHNEHDLLLERLQEETNKDEQLLKLY